MGGRKSWNGNFKLNLILNFFFLNRGRGFVLKLKKLYFLLLYVV